MKSKLRQGDELRLGYHAGTEDLGGGNGDFGDEQTTIVSRRDISTERLDHSRSRYFFEDSDLWTICKRCVCWLRCSMSAACRAPPANSDCPCRRSVGSWPGSSVSLEYDSLPAPRAASPRQMAAGCT